MEIVELSLRKRKNLVADKIKLKMGLNVLIGGNGSGKSSLMESVFDSQIKGKEKTVVSFSSGQNENFSDIYADHIKQLRAILNKADFPEKYHFYFDKKWAPILILLACSLRGAKPNGKEFDASGLCSGYLLEKQYQISDFEFSLGIPKFFWSLYDNKNEEAQSRVRESFFSHILEEITGADFSKKTSNAVKPQKFLMSEYTKASAQKKRLDGVLSNKLITGLNKILEAADQESQLTQIHHLLSFYQIASIDNSYLDLSEVRLKFEIAGQSVDFSLLSDGEFQLLSVFAIIDLFGGEYDFLLLDEVDSHIHSTLLPSLWQKLSDIKKSIVITSTHSPVSLKYVDSNRILSLRDGRTNDGLPKLADLQKIFDSRESSESVLALCFRESENLVLIDGLKDWHILISLFKRKLGDQFQKKLLEYSVYELSSTWQSNLDDGDEKDYFVDKLLSTYENDLNNADRNKIKLEKIVGIKDRDDIAMRNRYWSRGAFSTVKKSKKSFELSGRRNKIEYIEICLHRREIENYLLTKSVLEAEEKNCKVGWEKAGRDKPLQKKRDDVLKKINDEEFISCLDVKDFITEKLCIADSTTKEKKFSAKKAEEFIENLKPEEISDYLVSLHLSLCKVLGLDFRR